MRQVDILHMFTETTVPVLSGSILCNSEEEYSEWLSAQNSAKEYTGYYTSFYDSEKKRAVVVYLLRDSKVTLKRGWKLVSVERK